MVCEESLRHVGEVGSLLLIWLSEQPHNELNKHGSRCEVGDVGDRARDGFEQLRHVAPIERRAAEKQTRSRQATLAKCRQKRATQSIAQLAYRLGGDSSDVAPKPGLKGAEHLVFGGAFCQLERGLLFHPERTRFHRLCFAHQQSGSGERLNRGVDTFRHAWMVRKHFRHESRWYFRDPDAVWGRITR